MKLLIICKDKIPNVVVHLKTPFILQILSVNVTYKIQLQRVNMLTTCEINNEPFRPLPTTN